MDKVTAIIVAGGSGKRMGSQIKKQYIKLNDKEILAHTLEAFNKSSIIDEIIVVVSEDDIIQVREDIIEKYHIDKVSKVVAGGKERQDSVYNGLMAATKETKYVMIHDGARPFITQTLLKRALEATIENEATIVAVPVKDTIKVIDEVEGTVVDTPKRSSLWSVQTPQSFNRELLVSAYENAIIKKLAVTDDSMIVESYGKAVHVVEGDYNNIKITTPEDLLMGEQILRQQGLS